jgi:tetratricopeptide (TPR) repeat protein
VSDKLTKKQLREPDAFQKAGGEARDWLEQRRLAVVLIVVVGLLGFGGFAIASYVSQRGEEKAAAELGQTVELLQRPVEGSTERPSTPPIDGKPPFKSQKEKDEAVVKALTEFRQKHRKSKSAHTAALALGEAALRLGKQDEAIGAFTEYAQTAPQSDLLRANALEGLGYAHEAKGQLDEAIKAFERMGKETTGPYLQGMGQFHKGRILEQQGKKEEAARVFAELAPANAGTAAARLAGERMVALSKQGVTIPTPTPPAGATPDAG